MWLLSVNEVEPKRNRDKTVVRAVVRKVFTVSVGGFYKLENIWNVELMLSNNFHQPLTAHTHTHSIHS